MAEVPAPVSGVYDALFRPPLLTTKLYLPPARSNLVPRPRLIERLNARLTHRLTLISAPAGFGKTTLLSAWIPQSQGCVAWVSLDEGDNDPTRFWSYFISAVQMLESHLGQNALRLLESPQRLPFDLILTALLNDLTAFRQELAVVLDDYHVIENPAIHEALTFLLDHLPPQVNLIITTRVDPPLPLARLRGRGQLLELGAADLRFTSAEVTTFLNEVMGLPLTAQDIAALEERTEGWIAGLQLAALAMRDQTNLSGFVSAFTGSNRFVVDYLTSEVLARQPAHVQTFLLQTAILERLCGPLCDAVMGIAEVTQRPSSSISPPVGQPAPEAHSYSQILLETLERANLFLLPLDNDRRWYRYHHLFAEVLQVRLVSGATAEMVATLHRRAAAWYEHYGLLVEAIQHALAAADFKQAARLIEQVALPVMLPGQVHTLLGWLKALPETLLQASPALYVVHAAALVFINQMEAAEARLQAAEQALQQKPRSDQADLILGRAAAVRGALVRFCGDLARCAALSHQALDLLPETEFMWLVARLNTAYAFLVNGEVTPATERRVAAVIELIRPTRNSYILLRGMTLLARLQALQGRLKQATATYQEAAQVAPEQSGAPVVLNSSSYYFGLGDLLREWNELEAAERHLKQGLEMLSGAMAIEAEVATLGYMALALLKQAQGDRDGALGTLTALAELAQQRNFFPPLIERGRAIQARLQLIQGDLEAASRWVERRGLTAADPECISYLHELEYLTLVRVLIALGKNERRGIKDEVTSIHPSREALSLHPLKDALQVLDRLLPVAEANGRMGSVIEILNLRALALQAQGYLTEALAALERALTLAEPEGYVRLFLDEGKPMAELLERMKDDPLSGGRGGRLKEYIDKLLTAFEKDTSDRNASPSFIGRDAELAELSAGLEDAIAGRGRLFLIAGEPGIGKTMLAEQLAIRALERGARVLWGWCWEGGGAPAYWPWTQILRTLVEEPPEGVYVDMGADAADITKLVPELAERFGRGAAPDPSAQSAADRFRLFDAVTVLLRRASAVQPLLLVLDDLHAADPASLLLLRFIARQLHSIRLLVVATYRDVEAQRRADIVEMLGELVRAGRSVHLRGFGHAEVRQFMECLTGMAAAEDDVSRMGEATGGNPLFIREMLHLMGSYAALGWHGQPAVSEGVRAVIHQRLASLNADALQVLSVAAVVGQDFELPLVAQVSGLDLPHVLQSLVQAERLELVMRAPGSSTTFRFAHGLVREVLYDDLPIAVRRELHGKVGSAIERLYSPDLTSHLGALAYHFAQVAATGEGARAVEYARRAGDQALDSYAYEEAVVQYRQALEALPFARPDEALRCDLFLRLGTAQARAGNYQEAKGSFGRAAEIARRLEASEPLARAALGFGEPQVEGNLVDPQLLALLQEALDKLSPADSALRVQVLGRFSLELTFSNEVRLRESLSQEALAMARRLGDVSALAIACRARWMTVWGPEGLEERSALAEEILSLARQTSDREMELVGRARRITCSLESGDMRAVEADIAAHARLARELRMPYHEWTAATLRAGQALLDGSFEVAEELAQKALSLLPGRRLAAQAYLNQITPIRWEQGRLEELQGTWQESVAQFPKDRFSRGWLTLAELGWEDDARRGLRSLVEALPELPWPGTWLATLAVASLTAAHLDDLDAAACMYPLLLPYAGRGITVPMPHPVMCFGSASLYLGLLATAMSRWEEAVAHFEAAIRANTQLGARAFLARTQYEYARMLIQRGQAADRSQALALLARAEATARAVGMAALGQGIGRLRALEAGTVVAVGQSEITALTGAGGKNLFRKEGDYWTVVYEGSLVRLRDSKGLRHLARLLAAPGREFHVIDLETAESPGEQPSPGRPGRQSVSAELEVRPDLGDAGELLDVRAKAEYKARLEELRAELDEAERFNDPARAAKLKEEINFIARELARAVGLGGRDRKAASHAERARLNVTRAIKAALAHIDRHHPALGQHLRSTIRTGTYCSYSPDPRLPLDWQS